MAIKTWKEFGKKFGDDDDVRRALHGSGIDFKGMNDDEERIAAAFDYLKNNFKYWGEKRYDELRREYGRRRINTEEFEYTPSNIMAELGKYKDTEKDGVTTSALDNFRNDYWKADKEKRGIWKDLFEQNHGDNSWELVKRVMQADLHNKMLRDIEKGRADVIEGEAENSPWYDYALSSMMGLFTPRIKSAMKEGRGIGAADILGDVAENAAYAAFPVGRVGGLVAKGVAKPLAKALSQKTARGAGKLLGGAVAQFGAPATVETADWLMGNVDIGKNGISWTGEKDFEPEDILIGGLTNLGVNKALGRGAGIALSTLGRKATRGRIPKPVKERLEGVKSPRERADELIDEAKQTLILANTSPADAYRHVLKEGTGLPSVPDQENAIKILKVAEQADPEMRVQAMEHARDAKTTAENEIGILQTSLDNMEAQLNGLGIEYDVGAIGDDVYKTMKEGLEQEIKNTKNMLINKGEARKLAETRIEELESAGRAQTIIDELPKDLSYNKAALQNLQILNGPPPAASYKLQPVTGTIESLEAGFGLPAGTFIKNPELLSLFGKELKPTLGESALEGLFSWGVNKAGTDEDAIVASALLNMGTAGNVDVKKLREGQYARREQKKQARAAAVLQKSIEGQGWELTDEDRKWLKMIEQNPGMVQGYGAGAGQDFHKWMLLRGTDLLRDTELARPAFTAQ